MRLDVWAVMARHPDTGVYTPLGTNATEEGANHVAAEAIDAITLSHSFGPKRQRLAAAEMCASIKIIQAVLLYDDGDLYA